MTLASPFIACAAFWLIAGVSAAFDNLTAGLVLCVGALVFALLA